MVRASAKKLLRKLGYYNKDTTIAEALTHYKDTYLLLIDSFLDHRTINLMMSKRFTYQSDFDKGVAEISPRKQVNIYITDSFKSIKDYDERTGQHYDHTQIVHKALANWNKPLKQDKDRNLGLRYKIVDSSDVVNLNKIDVLL